MNEITDKRPNRNRSHYSSHQSRTLQRNNFNSASSSSINSVHTSPRFSRKTSRHEQHEGDYRAFREAYGSQVLLEKYRQIKKVDITNNRIKHYMDGGQENLFDKERKIELNIVEDKRVQVNQYGLPSKPEIKMKTELERSNEMQVQRRGI